MHVTSTVNGVDLDRLSGTIDAVTADPALARFQFRARNHWIDGGHSRTTIKDFYGAGQEDATRTEPFTVDTDEPPVLLGENRAPNAGEYVLHALAACLTGTIVYHAAARGIALDGLECHDPGRPGPARLPRPRQQRPPRLRADPGHASRPPATSTTTSSPSSPASPATRPSGTSSATPSPSPST